MIIKKKRNVMLVACAVLILAFVFVNIIASQTTKASFTKSGTSDLNVECAEFSDFFIVELYDGDEKIEAEDIEFNKIYTLKVYNKSTLTCDFFLDIAGTELNTFSNFVSLKITQDKIHNLALASKSSIQGEELFVYLNKSIVVTGFKPSDTPMEFTIQLSTAFVKDIIQSNPGYITDTSFDLKINVIGSTSTEQ